MDDRPNLHTVRTAFKEWAVVVEALGRGDQILLLRKGGIHDRGGLFEPEHHRFWLFPTLFHQQVESVVPRAAERFRQQPISAHDTSKVAIQFAAEVDSRLELRSLEAANRLAGHHIWKDDVIARRFDWGGKNSIHALIVRTFRLPVPIELERSDAYGGCRSWIELERDLPVDSLDPVMSDSEFDIKLQAIRSALDLEVPAP